MTRRSMRGTDGGASLQSTVSAIVARPLFWAALVAMLAAWPLVWALRSPLPPRLPVLGSLPRFELVDQSGRPFGSGDLAGRVWVASFIFTRCATVCPTVTRQMAQVQSHARNLEPAFHLVSISVDPEYDSPARLSEYARRYRASPRMWTFLTGRAEAIHDAVVNGFRVPMGREEGVGPEGISHGTHLVLVDGAGRIRGYYDAADPGTVNQVVRDAALLVNRG